MQNGQINMKGETMYTVEQIESYTVGYGVNGSGHRVKARHWWVLSPKGTKVARFPRHNEGKLQAEKCAEYKNRMKGLI